MIRINRPNAPTFLTEPGNKWHAEIDRAKIYYNSGANKSFEFEMFNDPKLKDELKKVFVKCAYCEHRYGSGYDGDVEHFRPKGKIKEKKPQTPGYYWLANDWDNLFLSCQHCNQKRKHLLYGSTKKESYGKLDQFPLRSELRRMLTPEGDIAEEENERLLINPCKDNPDIHFEYEKTEGVIIPLTDMGEVSVKVYALQRYLLVQERKMVLEKLLSYMEIIKLELEEINEKGIDEGKKEKLNKMLEALMMYTTDEAPYAGMCRFFIKKFLVENKFI